MVLEQCETEKRKHENFRILEWMYDLPAGKNEGQSKQQVDISSAKNVKERNTLFGWIALDRPLDIPPDNSSAAPSTGTSINILVGGVGVGLTHTKNLMRKNSGNQEKPVDCKWIKRKLNPLLE